MLSGVNVGQREAGAREFLVPQIGPPVRHVFVGIDSGKYAEFGVICYTGKDVTANDLFARYVDNRAKIPDVGHALEVFNEFLRQLTAFRVGNVLSIRYGDRAFQLALEHQRPPKAQG